MASAVLANFVYCLVLIPNSINMRKLLLFCMALAIPFLMDGQVRWDGGAGTTNWQDAMNWDTDMVPAAGSLVEFASNVTITGTVPNIPAQIKVISNNNLSLDLDITVGDGLVDQHGIIIQSNSSLSIVSNNTVTVNAPMTRHGLVIFTGATNAAFIVQNNAVLDIIQADQGIRNTSPTGIITNNGTINISNTIGDGVKVIDGSFTNAGSLDIMGAGGDAIDIEGTFDNTGDLSIDVLNSGATLNDGIHVESGSFNNVGTIDINIPGTLASGDNAIQVFSGASFENFGTIDLMGGLNARRIFIEGSFVNSIGGELNLGNDRMRINDGSFTNNGLLTSSYASGSAIWLPNAGMGTATNNGFFAYTSGAFAGGPGTSTNNGINLNNPIETFLDAGGSCNVDIAEAPYEWYDGATLVGTSDASGMLSLSMNTLSSDPAVLTNGLTGVTIIVQNVCAEALPIELVFFSAKPFNQLVRVEWQTAAEINNDYMAIERSGDGRTFKEIGRLRGAGNSNVMHYYSFDDHNPLPGRSYYRLRQVDFDGTATLSATVAVEIKVKQEIRAYPNLLKKGQPFTVEVSEEISEGELQFLLFDQTGKQIQLEKISKGNIQECLTQDLAAGLYFLNVKGNNFTWKERLLIVE